MSSLSEYFPEEELLGEVYPLINAGPDLPAGDMTGWTSISGGMINVGSRFDGGPVAGEQRSNQDISAMVGRIGTSDIDAEKIIVVLKWEQSSWSSSDEGWFTLEFLDNVDAVISYRKVAAEQLAVSATEYDTWWNRAIAAILPTGTRKIRVSMYNYRNAGTNTNGGLRNIVLTGYRIAL